MIQKGYQFMSEIFNDPCRTPQERTHDLLSKMTLEEKIGQMCQIDGRTDPESWIKERHIGSFLHVVGDEAARLQKIASEETRLGIPLIFGIDAMHGNAFHSGATVFPSQLGISSSWNPKMIERVGRITAIEVSLTGLHWTFSPVLCLGRDLRWGRVDETFGEDPYLVGVLGSAMVKGYQGNDLSDTYSILACAKHFAAYGETQGGRDSSECDVSRRKLKTIFLPPFKAVSDAGCSTFMIAYQSIDGVPCSANEWLIKDVLKNGWKFNGFVITDWNNLGHMHRLQKTSSTLKKACETGILAGNDMIMSTPEFYENAIELVNEGTISEELIDNACSRILAIKFKLGLFDHKRYPQRDKAKTFIGCKDHRKEAFESALQSMVLLKNENNILPLSDKVRKIAVIGPNADDVQAQLGDWSFGPRYFPEIPTLDYNKSYDITPIVTILEGIKKRARSGIEVLYEKGCSILDKDDHNIDYAVEIAQKADVVIAVVGDTILLNGECRDRTGLDLTGSQQELLEALNGTGKPLVVVLVNGKPLTIQWIKENADAIVEAWNPGMEGGNAVASVLFGDVNPCGKLTISFPRAVGQQPVFYNQYPGWHGGKYADMTSEPLFSFGFGLSYTSFAYSDLSLSKNELHENETLTVCVNIKNTGKAKGTEIAQFYVNDVFSSVTTPVKELKAFERVELNPGETTTVKVNIPVSSFSLVDSNCVAKVEPGEFEIMVGGSSMESDLLKKNFIVV
jgi:beta-glucosidase